MSETQTSQPRVTAAVVNWNGRAFLPGCLGSLREQQGVELETILIDNASGDDSLDYTRAEHPEVQIIENKTNRGYGAALNQAIRTMRGDYLLALNTDVRLTPGCCAALARCIENHGAERCGYAQGKALEMDFDGRPSGRLYSTGHLFPRNRLVYNRGRGQRDTGQYDVEERIPGGNAACLAISREMLEDMAVDGDVFDELFFLYGSDVDFDWLAACRGWSCYYCPGATAYHVGEGSSQISRMGFDAPFINVRFLLMLKNDRLADVARDLPFIIKRNLWDLAPKLARNPKLLFTIPIHLAMHAGQAWRSRRRTRALRGGSATAPREWFLWSERLLRESSRYD